MSPIPRVGIVRAGAAGPHDDQSGQSTVEMAVLLFLVMILMFVLVQGAWVLRDKVAVMHLARDAAREASVGTSPEQIAETVRRTIPGARVRVTGGGKVGAPVTVEVTKRFRTALPLVGSLTPDVTLRERVTMRSER